MKIISRLGKRSKSTSTINNQKASDLKSAITKKKS